MTGECLWCNSVEFQCRGNRRGGWVVLYSLYLRAQPLLLRWSPLIDRMGEVCVVRIVVA